MTKLFPPMSGVLKLQTDHIIKLAKEVEETQRDVIYTLGSVTESRSHELGNHVKRVAEVSFLLAIKYGLLESEAELLRMVSPMHDIGKIGIPDSILKKSAKLTKEEFELIKTHTTLGHSILQHSQRKLFKAAATVALHHHEWWNGSGYPNNLSGKEIHIFGRITAIADVFDALIHKRVYKHAWPIPNALIEVKRLKGKQFEPKIVNIFIDNINSILKICTENVDAVNIHLPKEDIYSKRREVLDLITHECIISGDNPEKCQAHELRKLPVSEIIEYVNHLSKEQSEDIINQHMACILNINSPKE